MGLLDRENEWFLFKEKIRAREDGQTPGLGELVGLMELGAGWGYNKVNVQVDEIIFQFITICRYEIIQFLL